MPARARSLALALLLGLPAAALDAQSNPVHTHIGHVADAFSGTPNGQGLLPTATAEAATAAQHAGFAAADPSNVEGVKRHVGHALHAVDPTAVAAGPGLGYGVRQAATGAARHIEMAAAAEGASESVTLHANHVATASSNVARVSEEIVSLGQRIQASSSAAEIAPLLEQLTRMTSALVEGQDADGDGRIGWQQGEGGLEQATQHMTLMKRGEGLAP